MYGRGWARAEGATANQRGNESSPNEIRNPKSEIRNKPEIRNPKARNFLVNWVLNIAPLSFELVSALGVRDSDFGLATAHHMISFRRPADFAPLSAEASTRASKPMGCGSLASGSIPSSSYMLPMTSHGYTGRSFTASPFASDAPTTWPPLSSAPSSIGPASTRQASRT